MLIDRDRWTRFVDSTSIECLLSLTPLPRAASAVQNANMQARTFESAVTRAAAAGLILPPRSTAAAAAADNASVSARILVEGA
jgi:hypothetical protein